MLTILGFAALVCATGLNLWMAWRNLRMARHTDELTEQIMQAYNDWLALRLGDWPPPPPAQEEP